MYTYGSSAIAKPAQDRHPARPHLRALPAPVARRRRRVNHPVSAGEVLSNYLKGSSVLLAAIIIPVILDRMFA